MSYPVSNSNYTGSRDNLNNINDSTPPKSAYRVNNRGYYDFPKRNIDQNKNWREGKNIERTSYTSSIANKMLQTTHNFSQTSETRNEEAKVYKSEHSNNIANKQIESVPPSFTPSLLVTPEQQESIISSADPIYTPPPIKPYTKPIQPPVDEFEHLFSMFNLKNKF